ncbi:MAG TPA: ATP-binding protein [Longimicrobiaceae bacterium]
MTTRLGGGDAAARAQATGHPNPREILGWIGGWGCVLAVSFWLSQLSLFALLAGALGAAAWTWSVRGEGRRRWIIVAALWLATVVGFSVHLRLREVATRWPELQREIEARAARALNMELDGLVTHGDRAVAALSRELQAGEIADSTRLFSRLELIRRAENLSALAIFDRRGVSVAWAGEHRGQIPVAVQRGSSPYVFYEGPLFSYLYFVYPLRDGGTAVAAVLLEASLETEGGETPFAARFEERHGVLPVFTYPNRAVCPSIWDWSLDRAILSACFTALSQSYWWSRVQERGRWEVAGFLLLAMGLLALRWYRRRMPYPGLPVGLITVALLMMPLGPMSRTETLFSPSQFVLPRLPWDVSLGVLLLVLTSGSIWLLTRAGGGRFRRFRIPWWGQAIAVAILLPAVLRLLRVSTGAILAARPAGGFYLQLAGVLLTSLPLFLLLLHSRRRHLSRVRPATLLIAGVAACAALAVVLALRAGPQSPSALWSSLWALPYVAFALALPHLSARYRPLRAWLVAGLVASSCVLPTLWTWHVEAKLRNAEERELSRLGTEANPYLDFRLRVFAEKAQDFAAEGETGVNLLYHSWIESRLAEEGYEARLTIWQNGTALNELRLTQLTDTLPSVVRMMVERHRGLDAPVVQLHTRVEGLHYLLLVPLPGGRTLSVAVPPRSRLAGATALARFLHQEGGSEPGAAVSSLYLVPSDTPAADSLVAEDASRRRVEWHPTENGWRSEAPARYPSGWMHAHLVVRTSSLPMLLIRGVLLTTALLGVLFLMWLTARLISRDLGDLPVLRPERLRSFRSRLTLTLFAFFLLPAGIFSAVAYSAVAREVILSAEAFARSTLEQTVDEISPGTPLWNVVEEVGADLLLYRRGTLEVAPAPEILELGLFDTWLPPSVYLAFAGGDDLEEVDRRRLGQNEYLVGYRRLEGDVVLAAPIALARDDIARRQTQFRDIALLLSLVGAALSVFLSLLVGRALTRPIDELSQAAATIGSGNLQVQLPESRPDEFGSVYRSFNRMATRLRSARAALIRETRRTETIVAEAATGVLALDADADVEMVNPRAAEILGAPLEVGQPLPRTSAPLRAVGEALDRFWRSQETEEAVELEVEGRILRLRMRRLTSGDGPGGAVVALEDVTGEIRSARVLAWGEMARQVAHEIKNPLTPIKLAVQHLRRAYRDRRPDYDEILDRNVESILMEIDRLGEIARAFSRFGTPDSTADRLESIDVASVVEETLTLYRGAGEGIQYSLEVDASHRVRGIARRGELKEVLVNLLENAREAVGESGEIRVSVNGAEHDRVEIAVADTGEGIPPELLTRVFEPHFSTRTSGTGLGLAIVRRMVESWGGEVVAESVAGRGTRVRVLIPRDVGGEEDAVGAEEALKAEDALGEAVDVGGEEDAAGVEGDTSEREDTIE